MSCSAPSTPAEDRQLGDDDVDRAGRGQRVRAPLDHLGLASRRRGGHRHDHAAGADDEVHRAADAEDVLAGHGPVRDVSVAADLERPEHGDVDVAAANHREARGAVEVRRAREGGDRLLRRVDQVGVELAVARPRPHPEQAVLGVQDDTRLGAEEPRDQVRDADPEVDDLARLQLERGAGRDPRLGILCHALATTWST